MTVTLTDHSVFRSKNTSWGVENSFEFKNFVKDEKFLHPV